MKKERNTKQKKVILDALIAMGHPTAQELFDYLHEQNPTLSRATVFRVLSQFAESGHIRKISMTGSDARFDATMKPHAHMLCVNCGTVQDTFVKDFDVALCTDELHGFKIYSAELNYLGCCKNCSGNS